MFDHNFIGFKASHNNALSMTNLSLNPKPKECNMIVDDMERNRLKVQIKKHCGSYYTWTIFPWPLHVGQMDSCFKNAFCITTLRIPPQVVHVCGLAPGGKPLASAQQQQLGVDDQRITNQ
jgi:hypothetical protein